MSGGCAAVRASTLLKKRLSVLAASCASRNFSRTLPVRYLSRISQSSVPGLRKISPCPCNSCRTVSAGFPRLLHTGKVHLAAFPQGNKQRILGTVGSLRCFRRFKNALPEDGRLSCGSRSGGPAGLAGHIRGNALVILHFQRFQQGMFRVFPHKTSVCLGIEMAVFSDKGVILRIEPLSQRGHAPFIAAPLFLIEQLAHAVPDLDHGNQTLPGSLALCGNRFIAAVAKVAGGLENDFFCFGVRGRMPPFSAPGSRRSQ